MLALLLHHHQPDYRDPATGEPILPWARMHATRGYRDVAVAIRETGARVTVNLVPSLLDQLDRYAAGGGDAWLGWVARPAEELGPEGARWVREHLTVGNERLFGWFAPYGRLRARARGGAALGVGELRDLQVWSQLAWFGWSALRDWPELRELRAKGEGYTEADKLRVLAVQRAILGELRGLHAGLPEVSASPYYHPILPLLVDTSHSQRALPGVPDPGFRHPEDALDQLVRGRARVEAWIGGPVRGVWPSEGSVSPEVVELLGRAGFRWFATDEEVLLRSERDAGGGAGADTGHDAPPHRGAWACGRLRALFRDHGLSDRIGFVYADRDPTDAVDDLLARAGDGTLLALDGENPWESYRDAGHGFLHELFARAELGTCAELAERRPRGTIRRLHTGSWIEASFRIWIGHAEDRAAWRLLARCRADWEAAGRPEAAREALYAAEGSDWFWWYGDDFETPVAASFDRLFRAHLAAAWRAMGHEPPPEVDVPLKGGAPAVEAVRAAWDAPPGDDWYTWVRAGRVRPRGGAMAVERAWPRSVELGTYAGRWYARRHGGEGEWSVGEGSHRVVVGEAWADVGEAHPVELRGPDGRRLPLPGPLG